MSVDVCGCVFVRACAYVCWVQSMDLCNPWIALRKVLTALCATIHGLSVDCAIHSAQSTDLRAIHELACAYCGSA